MSKLPETDSKQETDSGCMRMAVGMGIRSVSDNFDIIGMGLGRGGVWGWVWGAAGWRRRLA